MIPYALDVLQHAFLLILDGQPIDIFAIGAARTFAAVMPAGGIDGSGLQASGQQTAHDLVGEGFHAAVGMVDDEPLAGSTRNPKGGIEMAQKVPPNEYGWIVRAKQTTI